MKPVGTRVRKTAGITINKMSTILCLTNILKIRDNPVIIRFKLIPNIRFPGHKFDQIAPFH